MSKLGFSNDFSSFCLTFGNGFSISVVYGFGTYSDNKEDFPTSFTDGSVFDFCFRQGKKGSRTAEIAIFDRKGEFYRPEG